MSHDCFEKLNTNKRQAILNAGMLSFSKNGYKKTSVSDIALVAGISKAAIFVYFGTKKDFYLYLYDYAQLDLINRIKVGTNDFFESYDIYLQACLEIYLVHPFLFDFLYQDEQKREFEDMSEIKKIDDKNCGCCYQKLFDNVDWSRFKACYDSETVYNLVAWVRAGCFSKFLKNKSIIEVRTETNRYLSILKNELYKPEYL